MPAQIKITYKQYITDARAEKLKLQLRSIPIGKKIKNLQIADIYTIDKSLSKSQLKKISHVICNPVVQDFYLQVIKNLSKFNWILEVGFLPGVTDNIASTAQEVIEDLLKIKFSSGEAVYASQWIFLEAKLSEKQINKLAEEFINPIIQRVLVKTASQYKKDKGMGLIIPKVKLKAKEKVLQVDLEVDDQKLVEIGKKGIKDEKGERRGPLALDLLYMKAIKKYFKRKKRPPNDIELESIAQTWSEHCKHTIFADQIDEVKEGLFKQYIKRATDVIRKKLKKGKDICVSVFTDNSGAIEFDEKYLITDKVETHNSPSALDPFGGSITGIVGVNRDTIGFGLGAKPIINRYGFCFGRPKDLLPFYKGDNFTQKMFSPRRIMEGVIKGVNSGGNCSGIPTPQGFVCFDDKYKGKPLVFVGTVGIIPKKLGPKKSHYKKAKPGDYIVVVGGRVGADGIHGATFSSEALDSGSPSTAVQIGDPITQKKLSDALVKEANKLHLFSSITDNGAGGLSCSVAEMAKESGGCLVDLGKVPLKYPGLEPWQIWISESQERMTLSVPPKKWDKFNKLMTVRGVEATVIGRFTNSGKCIVKHNGEKIVDLHMDFLHDGLPERKLVTDDYHVKHKKPKFSQPKDLTKLLLLFLKRLNISGFEFISAQYDHEVQGGSVIKPLQGAGRINGEASITRPILSSKKGIVTSQGLYPTFSQIDSYHMAACCIDTAVRNAVSAGANPEKIVLLDNFCWCSSTEPKRLAQLKAACQACFDYAVSYKTPFISGKDSMFNDFKGFNDKGKPIKISIHPTLLISSLAIIEDIYKAVSIDLKLPGDLIYIIGETKDELGGSEYFEMIGEKNGKEFVGNSVPKVDVNKNKKIYKAYYKAIKRKLIASAIPVNRGGLLAAIAKASIGGQLGADISLSSIPGKTSRLDYLLFSESQGRILASIAPKNKKKFEEIFKGLPIKLIGKVKKDKQFVVRHKRKKEIQTSVDLLTKSYKSTFKDY